VVTLPPQPVQRIVIVGAGECAARTIVELRKRSYTGSIVLLGNEVHAPYERPPLSKQTLLDSHTPSIKTVLGESRLSELAVSFDLDDAAVKIDRASRVVRTAGNSTHLYDRLIISTGARSRELTFPGAEHALMLRTFDDASVLRKELQPKTRVVVIGAGFIGLELAATARTLGCEVSVIEVLPRLMGRAVPPETAAVVERRHREEGVILHLENGVQSIEHPAGTDQYIVYLADGTELLADVVVAGIGAVPETTLATECELGVENGITADEHLRTSDDAIFAAGDCVNFPHPLYGNQRVRLETWQNAHDHGILVAINALGGDAPVSTAPWFWSDQYDLTLQVAGLAMGTTNIVRTRTDGVQIHFSIDDDGRLLSAAGVSVGGGVARDIRLAKMLIEQRTIVSGDSLEDPTITLKSMLTPPNAVGTPTHL
jgi:3-phenylpropionate/trans-cinnamate dioxygenase ferredoxin reductase component